MKFNPDDLVINYKYLKHMQLLLDKKYDIVTNDEYLYYMKGFIDALLLSEMKEEDA